MEADTIFTRVFGLLQRIGAKPFVHLMDGEGRETMGRYGVTVHAAIQWAGYLQTLDLKKGDRVIVILPHSIDTWISYLGAVFGGFVPTFFAFPSAKLSKEAYFETIEELIDSADAGLIITYQELAEELRPLCKIPVITSQDRPNEPLKQFNFPAANPTDPAFIQYSSGTTGLKKGVAVTHQMLLNQVDEYAASIALSDRDVIASWLPLYHDMGLITCYWLPILTGTPVVTMSPFDWVRRPQVLLELVSRFQATLCWLPNFAYQHIAHAAGDSGYDLRSLRALINCSEPLTLESHAVFLQKFASQGMKEEALWGSYAMAENTFAVTSGRVVEDYVDALVFSESGRADPVSDRTTARTLLSSGPALPGTEVRICDDRGEPLAERQVGEICIRSSYLMSAYFNGPLLDGEFFATGDLGYLADQQLYVTGRKKDLIIVAGKNIYPQDIESVVNKVPGVVPGRCVAIGVDNQGTQDLLVLAETKEGSSDKRDSLRFEIAERIAQEVDVAVAEIGVLDHRWLRKSSSGKICRKQNLQRYQQEERSRAPKQQVSLLFQQLQDVLEKSLEQRGRACASLALDQPLIRSGIIDSLSLVTLMVELEKAFQITIPPRIQADPSRFDTLQHIGHWVAQLQEKIDHEPSEGDLRRRVASTRDRKCTDLLASSRDYELLILGSSRVDGLSAHKALQYGYKAFNFTVNSANAEDWYCGLRFVLEHNRIPLRRVLLGVDIESLNGHLASDQRLINCPYLRPYLDIEDTQTIEEKNPADQGLSDALQHYEGPERVRFQTVLLNLRNQGITQPGEVDYDPVTGDVLFLEAGTLRQAYQERSSLDFSGKSGGHFQMQTEMRLAEFHQLCPRRIGYFTRLVELCRQNGITLDCFLTPMHPAAKRGLVEDTAYAERVLDFLDLAKSLGIEATDYSEPSTFGGLDVDFRDEMHMGPHNSDCLLGQLIR